MNNRKLKYSQGDFYIQKFNEFGKKQEIEFYVSYSDAFSAGQKIKGGSYFISRVMFNSLDGVKNKWAK